MHSHASAGSVSLGEFKNIVVNPPRIWFRTRVRGAFWSAFSGAGVTHLRTRMGGDEGMSRAGSGRRSMNL